MSLFQSCGQRVDPFHLLPSLPGKLRPTKLANEQHPEVSYYLVRFSLLAVKRKNMHILDIYVCTYAELMDFSVSIQVFLFPLKNSN